MSAHDPRMTDTSAMLRATISDFEQSIVEAEREIETIERTVKTERPARAQLIELTEREAVLREDVITYNEMLVALRTALTEELAHDDGN